MFTETIVLHVLIHYILNMYCTKCNTPCKLYFTRVKLNCQPIAYFVCNYYLLFFSSPNTQKHEYNHDLGSWTHTCLLSFFQIRNLVLLWLFSYNFATFMAKKISLKATKTLNEYTFTWIVHEKSVNLSDVKEKIDNILPTQH